MKSSRKGFGHHPSLDHWRKGHCLQGQGTAVTRTTLVLLPGPSPPFFHETSPSTRVTSRTSASGWVTLAVTAWQGVTPASPTCPRQQGQHGPWMCSWNSLGQAGSRPTDMFQLLCGGSPLPGQFRGTGRDQEPNSKMWWANKAGVCLQHLSGACRPGHPQTGREWGLGPQGDSSRLLPSHPRSRRPHDLGHTHTWHRGLVAVAAGRLGRAGL